MERVKAGWLGDFAAAIRAINGDAVAVAAGCQIVSAFEEMAILQLSHTPSGEGVVSCRMLGHHVAPSFPADGFRPACHPWRVDPRVLEITLGFPF